MGARCRNESSESDDGSLEPTFNLHFKVSRTSFSASATSIWHVGTQIFDEDTQFGVSWKVFGRSKRRARLRAPRPFASRRVEKTAPIGESTAWPDTQIVPDDVNEYRARHDSGRAK